MKMDLYGFLVYSTNGYFVGKPRVTPFLALAINEIFKRFISKHLDEINGQGYTRNCQLDIHAVRTSYVRASSSIVFYKSKSHFILYLPIFLFVAFSVKMLRSYPSQ